jgi:hypothetical protein
MDTSKHGYENSFIYLFGHSILHNFLNILLFFSQSASHGGQECSNFMAYAMAHKGRATSDVSYNPEDPPSAYSNATVHSCLSQYIEVAKEVHGLEYDPTTANIDGEVVMRAGGGKKHGWYWIGDSTIDTAATPSLTDLSKEHEVKPGYT